MKKSFMTRVLAVSLSTAMAFSMSPVKNPVTASAASTVQLKTTFKTLKVKQTYQLKLKNNKLDWKISKVKTTDKTICTVYDKKASSVMLKGKKEGRATISVTVTSAKRKKAKKTYTKTMKCRANVKGNADDNQNPSTAFGISSVTATSSTTVDVTFTQAIDAADKSNFAVTGAASTITVENAQLSADKKTVTLTLSGTAYSTMYSIATSGLKVNGADVANQTATFTTPAQTSEYTLEMTNDLKSAYLKSDGASSTVVTCQIKDKDGKLMENSDIVLEFTATRGNLGSTRVTAQKGVATNTFRSEFLSSEQTATITATVVESRTNTKLYGLTQSMNIIMTPDPDSYSAGATIISAESNVADRVIAYFDKDVDVASFKKANGEIDWDKVEIEVKSGLSNGHKDTAGTRTSTNKTGIADLLPVENNSKAIAIVVKDQPLIDNSNVSVKFKNKAGSVSTENTAFFKLTDARQPEVVKVDNKGYRTITVEFSESVLPKKFVEDLDANGNGLGTYWSRYGADFLNNYTIDGVPLDNTKYGTASGDGEQAKVSIGTCEKGTDERYLVTITLGKDSNGKRVYLPVGKHSIQVSNVGDWAAQTDYARNIVETQTLDFEVEEDTTVPTIESVEVQSPEQYLVTFNCPVAYDDTENPIQDLNNDGRNTVIQLRRQENRTGSWKEVGRDDVGSFNNPIRVTYINDQQCLVEVTKDWTQVYNTRRFNKNYFNDAYQIRVASGVLENTDNGKTNSSEVAIALEGAMLTDDNTSVQILDVEKKDYSGDQGYDWGTYYSATMSEPVKIRNEETTARGNAEGLTPSQQQSDDNGVPIPSAYFVNKSTNRTVQATILGFDVTKDGDCHKQIAIRPRTALGGGDWTLVVRSISDDVGNTAATLTKDFDVTASEKQFKVAWAVVAEDDKNGNNKVDITEATKTAQGRTIFIKFTDAIAVSGDIANVTKESNYTINGRALPQGTTIRVGIEGYDSKAIQHGVNASSITITLPANYYVNGDNTVVNISPSVQSRAGATLQGDNEIRLPYQYFDDGRNQDDDAVWGNHPTEQRNAFDSDRAYHDAVQSALDNEQYREVKLDASVNGDLRISRALREFDLGGNDINGNVDIVFDEGATYTIKGTGHIKGDVSINTPMADCNWELNGGKVILWNVLSETFTVAANAKVDDLVVYDTDGIAIDNKGTISKVNLDTTGKVTMMGAGDYPVVIASAATDLTVANETSFGAFTVSTNVRSITVNITDKDRLGNVSGDGKVIAKNGRTETTVQDGIANIDKNARDAAKAEVDKLIDATITVPSNVTSGSSIALEACGVTGSALKLEAVYVEGANGSGADYLKTDKDSLNNKSVSFTKPKEGSVTEYIVVVVKYDNGYTIEKRIEVKINA